MDLLLNVENFRVKIRGLIGERDSGPIERQWEGKKKLPVFAIFWP